MSAINMSDVAFKDFKQLLEDNKVENNTVRINLAGMGWSGPMFNLVLDEQKNDDMEFEVNGLKVVAENDLSPMLSNALISHHKGLFGNSFRVSSDASSNC